MSISSVSLTFFSMVSTPAASAPVAAAPGAANDAEGAANRPCEGHGHARRNVLYDAMMSALRELGLGQKPTRPSVPDSAPGPTAAGSAATSPAVSTVASIPAPATSTTPAGNAAAAAAPQPAAAPAASVEDAVLSFAHALWQSLRGSEGGGSGQVRERGDDDEGHHRRRRHGHHHDHGQGYGMARDYSGLATRLEALAVRIETGPAAFPDTTPTSTPVTTPAAATAPAGNIAPIKASGTDPVLGDATAPSDQPRATTPAALPSVPARNPLADAFAAMLKVLRGADSAPSNPGVTEPSLSGFLHSLARGLGMDRSAPTVSAVGVMINVSA